MQTLVKGFREGSRDKLSKIWGMISLSSLGFIGKLFRSCHLQQLAAFFVMFHDEKPVDWLIYNFLDTKDLTIFLSETHIFHHIGTQSSLHGKQQSLVDLDFPRLYAVRQYLANKGSPPAERIGPRINPPAMLFSTMGENKYYSPQAFYNTPDGIYWAESVKNSTHFTVLFRNYQLLEGVSIITGMAEHPGDVIRGANLYAGTRILKAKKYVSIDGEMVRQSTCTNDVLLGKFENGRVGVRLQSALQAACLSVVVTESQKSWAIFNQIHINSKDSGKSTTDRKNAPRRPDVESVKHQLLLNPKH